MSSIIVLTPRTTKANLKLNEYTVCSLIVISRVQTFCVANMYLYDTDHVFMYTYMYLKGLRPEPRLWGPALRVTAQDFLASVH